MGRPTYPSRSRLALQDGVTLVELLVVVTILGVIGAIATAGIVASLESARTTTARVDALQELEIGGQRIIRELRVAQSLVLAKDATEGGTNPTPFERELGADIRREGSPDGSTITFRVLDGDGDEPARLISETDGAEQTLVTLVNLDGADPIFRYLDSRGEELECVVSCAATYAQAERIEVVLRRNVGEGRDPVTVRSQVTVRNVRYPVVTD